MDDRAIAPERGCEGESALLGVIPIEKDDSVTLRRKV
jgi:hypothetical protein